MRPRYPLRMFVPALTFGVGALGAVFVLVTTLVVSTQQAQRLGRGYVTNIGHSFASDLQIALRRGDIEGVRTRVLRANAFGVSELAILFDEADVALYSSKLSAIGKPVSQTPFASMSGQFEYAKRNMRLVSQAGPQGDAFMMLIPLRLAPAPGELIATRVGTLGLSFKLAPWKAIAKKNVTSELIVMSLLVALLAAMSGILMNALVTRRVARLVEVSGYIAEGKFDSVVEVQGGDEIAELSATIGAMSQKLSDSMRHLAQSTERLQGIVSNSPQAIFLGDLKGNVLLANEQFCKWTGIEQPKGGASRPVQWDNAELAAALNAMDQAILEGHTSVDREIVLPAVDGAERIVDVIKFAVKDSAGELVGIGMIASDISEWRRTEEQLRHAQKMKAVGQLTGGLAHDFNNILQAISGNLELLQQIQPEQGESSKYIEHAMEAAAAGARLTARLLAASRRQVLQPRPLLLNDILESMSELVVRTLGKNVEVQFSTQPGLWQCAADLSQLENAILNLAINARDAMPEGGVLRFETENVVAPEPAGGAVPKLAAGEYVRLSAIDQGHGMSAEVADRAFEPFFTTKNAGSGSGLGLSTIYGFVTQSGGHVELHSQPGGGTNVSIYLPRSSESRVEPSRPEAESTPAGSGEVVLVVEDNTHVRRLTEALLTNLGYRCIGVPTAPEAIEMLETGVSVDVLLTDVVLPGGISGAELARHVKKDMPHTGIILMSGFAADSLFDSAGLNELGPILQKPFRKGALARALRNAVTLSKRPVRPA